MWQQFKFRDLALWKSTTKARRSSECKQQPEYLNTSSHSSVDLPCSHPRSSLSTVPLFQIKHRYALAGALKAHRIWQQQHATNNKSHQTLWGWSLLRMAEEEGLAETASSKQPIRAVCMLAYSQVVGVDVPSLAQWVGVAGGGNAANFMRRAPRPPAFVRGRCSSAFTSQC